MKKILAILALAVTSQAFAADFVSVSVEHVTDRTTSAKSTVEYVRAGKEINGLQYGLQSRSARSNDGTGLYSSLEGTIGKNLSVAGLTVTPFVGAGRDLTKNGASEPYTYGVVGANVGTPVAGGYALAGVKTRAGSTENTGRTKQTLVYAEYAYPVAKNLAVTAGLTRSTQDIKERAFSVGVSVGF
jgi:hypothetical protein